MKVEKLWYPFYNMIHPVNGYEGIKWERKGSFLISVGILFFMLLTNIYSFISTGYIFNPNRPDKIDLLMEIVKLIVPFILWVVANWSLCTLLDGEGRFKEIWIATSYALMPMLVLGFLLTLTSNVLAYREGSFLAMFQNISKYWSLLMLVCAMKEIHQYTIKKTILSMVFTVVGMLLIFLLIVLTFALFQQFFTFIRSLYFEILYKI